MTMGITSCTLLLTLGMYYGLPGLVAWAAIYLLGRTIAWVLGL